MAVMVFSRVILSTEVVCCIESYCLWRLVNGHLCSVHVSIVFPAVIFEHMNEFNDELALLVLLAVLIRMFILPAQCCFTTLTEYVRHMMQPGQ